LEFRDTVRLAGVTLTEKSPLTTSVTIAVWVNAPLVAVIVNG